MKSLLAKLVPHQLRQSIKRKLFVVQDMTARLKNLQRAGFTPTGVIDGGAYQGDWTKEIWAVWPQVPVAIVEPLEARQAGLKSLAQTVVGTFVVPNALAAQSGVTHFALGETNSGIVSEASAGTTVEVSCTTLETLLEEHPSFKPNFLKLDLQGHELPALKGAGARLQQFEVVLLEVSVIRIGEVPSFSEMDQFMISQGFRIYDVIPQYYRPLDGALWQMDVFFVRNDSPLVASREWQ
jgi:FkbM family methyltransferase